MDEPRIESGALDSSVGFSLTIRRNRSLRLHAARWLFVLTACIPLAIGIGFALVGAWPVLPFAGLEVAALAVAFGMYARHAADRERIVVRGGAMQVQVQEAGRVRVHEFRPGWVQLITQRSASGVRVGIRSHGRELEIGRHLDASAGGLLAVELAGRLKRYRNGSSR
jgi:uncharacterized membrane protein